MEPNTGFSLKSSEVRIINITIRMGARNTEVLVYQYESSQLHAGGWFDSPLGVAQLLLYKKKSEEGNRKNPIL